MISPTLTQFSLILLCIIPRVIASPINIDNLPTKHLIPRIISSRDSSSSDPKTAIILRVVIVISILVVGLALGTLFHRARKQRAKKMQQQRPNLSLREYAYKPPPYTGTMRRDVPLPPYELLRETERMPPPYEPQQARRHTAVEGGLAEPASAHMAGGMVR